MNTRNSGIVETIRALVDDLGALIGKEFELAKAEAGEKMQQLQTGLVSIVFGMLVGFCALLVVIEAIVVALARIMPPSLAAASVGVVLAVIAYFAIRNGETHLRPSNLAPRRTIRSVSEQTTKIKESMQ